MLGIYAKVRLVAPKSISRSEGKAVRVIDRRNPYLFDISVFACFS